MACHISIAVSACEASGIVAWSL